VSGRLLAAALLAALAVLPGGAAAAPFEVEVPSVEEGQPRIILARRPGRLATLHIRFAAGAVEDGGRAGLARLTQHALLSSNRRVDMTALLMGVHAAAGDLVMETHLRDCGFTLTADRRDFPELARQLATAVLSPQLEARRFPAALARALLDGRRKGGDATLLSQVATLVVDDPRYQNEPHGDRDSLESLTFQDVQAHLRGPLAPANATVVVTGGFDRDEILRLLRSFGGGQASPPSHPSLGLPFRARRAAAQETHVLGYTLRLETPRDAAAARLAAALLDDEFWRRFRQVGVGYSYVVAPLRSAWLDLLVVLLPAHDPSSLDLAPQLLDAVQRLRAGGFDDAQLARARGAARARLAEADRHPVALARLLADGGPDWHGKAVDDELAALDRATLAEVFSRWLTPERTITVYMGPTP
jgi:predicted Zn-dependent peptidase